MALRPLVQLSSVLVLVWAVTHHSSALLPTATPTQYHCYASLRTNLDDQNPSARCFGVRDGLFTGVYTDNELAALTVDDRHVTRHDKAHVIPGLWDGHGHVLAYGEFLHSVDLFGADSFANVRSRIDDYVVKNPHAGSAESWIRGVGWDQVLLGRMPTAVSAMD